MPLCQTDAPTFIYHRCLYVINAAEFEAATSAAMNAMKAECKSAHALEFVIYLHYHDKHQCLMC